MAHRITHHIRLAAALIAVLLISLAASNRTAMQGVTATPGATATARALATTSSTTVLTATYPPMLDSKVSLLFPMAIRFNLVLNMLPTQLKSVRLHLSQGTVYDQSVDLPVTPDLLKPILTNMTLYTTAWPLNPQTAPVPFQPLDIMLTMTSTANVISTYQTQIMYVDNTQQWKNTVGDILSLYTHNSVLAIDRVQQGVLRAYPIISHETGINHTFRMVIYETGITPCLKDAKRQNQPVVIDPVDSVEFPCDPTAAAALYKAQGFTPIMRTSPQIDMLQDQITETIAADAYDTLWKTATTPPPAWFRAGLATRYDVVGHGYALLQARDAARSDQLLSLNDLAVPAVAKPDDFGASIRAWNAQSYLLTLYLAAQFGADAPVKIAQAMAQNSDFNSALASIGSGVKIEDIYATWKGWLFSSAADEAIAWTPYLIDATPTHTPSPTDFPTITPTDSGPTVTDTPLFAITPTLRPTPTSALTSMPTQPTSTGSLSTATAAGSH